jgi:hypothetical protein
MSTAEERMQNEIDELEQENRLLRARNERLEAELMQMQGRELKLQFALNKPVQEPAFYGFMDEEECCVHMCFTPNAPGGPNNELATAYYTSPHAVQLVPSAGPITPAMQKPAYAWSTIADYEEDVGFKVNEVFKMAWNMARTTNALFKQMEKNA